MQEVQPLVCKVSHGHEENILPTLSLELALASQEDLEVAEHNRVVKDDSLDLEPSRGCPIRHLALQKIIKFPLVMLIPEYEDLHQKEQACFASADSVPMLESFIVFSIGKAFQVTIDLLGLFLSTGALMHGRSNQLVRKSSYFNKPINGFV